MTRAIKHPLDNFFTLTEWFIIHVWFNKWEICWLKMLYTNWWCGVWDDWYGRPGFTSELSTEEQVRRYTEMASTYPENPENKWGKTTQKSVYEWNIGYEWEREIYVLWTFLSQLFFAGSSTKGTIILLGITVKMKNTNTFNLKTKYVKQNLLLLFVL